MQLRAEFVPYLPRPDAAIHLDAAHSVLHVLGEAKLHAEPPDCIILQHGSNPVGAVRSLLQRLLLA